MSLGFHSPVPSPQLSMLMPAASSFPPGGFWKKASGLRSPKKRKGMASPPGASGVGGQRGARPLPARHSVDHFSDHARPKMLLNRRAEGQARKLEKREQMSGRHLWPHPPASQTLCAPACGRESVPFFFFVFVLDLTFDSVFCEWSRFLLTSRFAVRVSARAGGAGAAGAAGAGRWSPPLLRKPGQTAV